MNEPTIEDVYEQALPRIIAIHHAFDMERITRPDLYGPPPQAVLKRLRRWFGLTSKGIQKEF